MGTEVATSYTAGTIISLGACEAAFFFEGIAVSLVARCREAISDVDARSSKAATNIPHFDDLIERYCGGAQRETFYNMLRHDAQILYAFVKECVFNETVAGLYLLRESPKNGEPAYKLITLALEEYEKMRRAQYSACGRAIPRNLPKYTEYNNRFEKMFLR